MDKLAFAASQEGGTVGPARHHQHAGRPIIGATDGPRGGRPSRTSRYGPATGPVSVALAQPDQLGAPVAGRAAPAGRAADRSAASRGRAGR